MRELDSEEIRYVESIVRKNMLCTVYDYEDLRSEALYFAMRYGNFEKGDFRRLYVLTISCMKNIYDSYKRKDKPLNHMDDMSQMASKDSTYVATHHERKVWINFFKELRDRDPRLVLVARRILEGVDKKQIAQELNLCRSNITTFLQWKIYPVYIKHFGNRVLARLGNTPQDIRVDFADYTNIPSIRCTYLRKDVENIYVMKDGVEISIPIIQILKVSTKAKRKATN